MAKIPSVKPFNITQYAERNKLKSLGSIDVDNGSKVHFLSKSHQIQCLHLDKDGQVIGWKAAISASIDNLTNMMSDIVKKIKQG